MSGIYKLFKHIKGVLFMDNDISSLLEARASKYPNSEFIFVTQSIFSILHAKVKKRILHDDVYENPVSFICGLARAVLLLLHLFPTVTSKPAKGPQSPFNPAMVTRNKHDPVLWSL